MTNEELMYAALLALTKQNIVHTQGGGTPIPMTIGYMSWEGEVFMDVSGEQYIASFTLTPIGE